MSEMLWDQITKSNAQNMPDQFLPVFAEVFGKSYPPGTNIKLLPTSYSVRKRKEKNSPTSIISDIALLVDEKIFIM